MIVTLVFVGCLAAVVSAGQISAKAPPSLSKSRGFHLVINVTDPSKDFSPSVQGQQIVAWHMLAVFNRAMPVPRDGDIFYQNGTASERDGWHSALLTELATNTASLNIDWSNSTKHDMHVDIGSHEIGLQISEYGGYPFVSPFEPASNITTFVVCKETVQWVSRNETDKFLALDLLLGSVDENGKFALRVPENCTPVKLLPRCAKLPDVPEGSRASHEFAQEVPCFEDV
jgi:hypothetical protein